MVENSIKIKGKIKMNEELSKPYPNEHACRLNPPSKYSEFRRGSRDHNGKKYSVIYGKIKGKDSWEDQAYRYKKDSWDVNTARIHCKNHGGNFEPAKKEKSIQEGGEVIMEEKNVIDELVEKVVSKMVSEADRKIEKDEKNEPEEKDSSLEKKEDKTNDTELVKKIDTLTKAVEAIVNESNKKKEEDAKILKAQEDKKIITENIKTIMKEMGVDLSTFGKRKGVVKDEHPEDKTDDEDKDSDDITKGIDAETISLAKFKTLKPEVKDALVVKTFKNRMGIENHQSLMKEIEELED